MSDETQKTILFSIHEELGARMSPFGGFLMPIQYEGIIKEHEATRRGAALFDTCHMGEFRLRGETALQDLENLISCNIASLEVGRCRYGFMCNDDGGVIDDLLVYRLAETEFMLVVNAGTQEGDLRWIMQHVRSGTEVFNIGEWTAKVDLQGPAAPKIMQELVEESIGNLIYYSFMQNRYANQEIMVSRTGYTGEIGFEIYCDGDTAVRFWRDAMQLGAVPAGLGARDTLRLEMGMPLYGHELSKDRNAAEAGFTRAIATDKDFIGSSVVRDTAQRKSDLVGIRLEGRRAAREGSAVLTAEGATIGMVSSGSMAPSLGCAVALAYVQEGQIEEGTGVKIQAQRAVLDGRIVRLPFYVEATGRRKMADFI